MDAVTNRWWDDELAGCVFADARLGQRLRKLLERMEGAIGESLPLACQDWASTKAAYRFFSNDRVSEEQILAGHFQATHARFAATDGVILVLHDTTEFTYQRKRTESIGLTYRVNSGMDRTGRFRMHTVCGLLMHASLAVTMEGLPLGLAAIRFWSRQKFKGLAALKRRINPTRVPIEHKESIRWLENMRQSTSLLGEPARCIHVGDRESDIYELFCLAQNLGTHFLVRTCVDRLAGNGGHTIADEMKEVRVQGMHHVEVRDGKGRIGTAAVELRYRSIRVLPPVGKQKRYPALILTVIHAKERGTPAGRPAIDWKLITDLPVLSCAAAVEKLRWYAMRWKIEVFHKILKSGCRAEQARLRTAERLVKLIAVFCILSWRIFWMTMIQRSAPLATPKLALTDMEITILDRLVPNQGPDPSKAKTLSAYLLKIARLGGYLARTNDPPPGNTVMWRGLTRLTDIRLGVMLATTSPSYG
ncbi:IS4 family transposase [Geminicoccus roseus]|uniref:IS4 family transposase n=1 Tax=Geminicoccus roseus TaxID=404900 RepID=UPI0003F58446|nr:IS4 family transposase [Geminicoccus roseus]